MFPSAVTNGNAEGIIVRLGKISPDKTVQSAYRDIYLISGNVPPRFAGRERGSFLSYRRPFCFTVIPYNTHTTIYHDTGYRQNYEGETTIL